jgi:hypothetical protein
MYAACRFLFAILVVSLAVTCAQAARLGDKGKGWKVKRNKDSGFLYCEYNGKFQLSPGSSNCQGKAMGFTDPGQGCTKFHPVTLKSSADVKSTTFTIKPLKRGKDGAPKGYQIIAGNKCVAKYLSLIKSPGSVNPGTDVPLELTGLKKWTWAVRATDGDMDSIDCLDNVDIMSQKFRSSLTTNNDCSGFQYDDTEAYWTLTPV